MLKLVALLGTLALLGTTFYFKNTQHPEGAYVRSNWFSSCPKVNVVQQFNVQDYLGIWYEQRRMTALPFEKGDCGKVKYGLKDDGKIAVSNTGYLLSENKFEEAYGEARKKDNSGNGRLQVRFSKWQPWGDYRVVDTDYTSHSIVYSCSTILYVYKVEYLWVLSRAPYQLGSELYNSFVEKTSDIIKQALPDFDLGATKTPIQGGNCQYKDL